MNRLRQRMTSPVAFRLALALALLAAGASQAIVYTLRPGTGAGTLYERLGSRTVLEDDIVVNGHKGGLRVGTSSLAFADAVATIKALLVDYRHSAGARSLLLEEPSRKGRVVRHYVLSVGNAFDTLVFSVDLPAQALAKGREPVWPRRLPTPHADRVGLVLSLAGRDALFGSFVSGQSVSTVFRDYDARLQEAGWKKLSGHPRGGAVYVDRKMREMVTFAVLEGEAGTRAAVFLASVGGMK